MERNKTPLNPFSVGHSELSKKRDQYITDIKEKNKKETIQERRNQMAPNDPSILDIVRAKIDANLKSQSQKNKVNLANILENILPEDIEAALAVRAEGLQINFDIVINELPTIESTLRSMISQGKNSKGEFNSPEAFKRAQELATPTLSCQYLVRAFRGFSQSLNTGNPLTIGTAIIGAGVLKEKLEKLIGEVKSAGLDVKALEEASEGMRIALDGVGNVQLDYEPE